MKLSEKMSNAGCEYAEQVAALEALVHEWADAITAVERGVDDDADDLNARYTRWGLAEKALLAAAKEDA